MGLGIRLADVAVVALHQRNGDEGTDRLVEAHR
jgi:hypothetical protein